MGKKIGSERLGDLFPRLIQVSEEKGAEAQRVARREGYAL